MRLWITMLSAVMAIAVGTPRPLYADTAAEMLEKGIYNEETVGNLDEAIKIYRQVVDAASQTEKLAARAQFRMAQCLLKQQKQEQAVEAFKTLVERYPRQKELVEKAKQHLPETLQLSSPPWKDGERLTLTMKLPGGQTIGMLGLGVDSGTYEGKDIWKMTARRFVGAGQNEGVSTVMVDQSSNRPLRTVWDHTILGISSANWGDHQVVITSTAKDGKTETKTVEFDGAAYANDQWFYGFRQLPLEIGYKVTIPIRVAFTGGNGIGLELDVQEKERVTTPVGEFDCFRIETNIQQTFWVADVPERYLVKFTGGGVDATLSSISSGETPATVENSAMGISFTLPRGWFSFQAGDGNQDNKVAYQLVAPQMASAELSLKDKSLLSTEDQESLEAWMKSKIERGKRTFKSYTVRPGSMRDTELAGGPAKTYTVDCEVQGTNYTRHVVLAMPGSKAVGTAATARKKDFDDYQKQFEAFRKSISVK